MWFKAGSLPILNHEIGRLRRRACSPPPPRPISVPIQILFSLQPPSLPIPDFYYSRLSLISKCTWMGYSNPDCNQVKKIFSSFYLEQTQRTWSRQGWPWLLEIPAPLPWSSIASESLHGSQDCTERPSRNEHLKLLLWGHPGTLGWLTQPFPLESQQTPTGCQNCLHFVYCISEIPLRTQPPTINNPIQTSSMNVRHTETGPMLSVTTVCSLRGWLYLLLSCPPN